MSHKTTCPIIAIYEARPVALEKAMKTTGQIKQYWLNRVAQLNAYDGQWDTKKDDPEWVAKVISLCEEITR